MKLDTCYFCNTYINEGEDLCLDCALFDEGESRSIESLLDSIKMKDVDFDELSDKGILLYSE